MSKPVILTGLRANNDLHLGNYLGALLPMIELQKKYAREYQINLFIPDLHSFTTPIDHSKLYQNTLDNLKVFAATGLDIKNPDTFIYRQSYIPAHSELAWILGCFTSYGQIRRQPSLKEKIMAQPNYSSTDGMGFTPSIAAAQKSNDEEVLQTLNMGLINYPILMAADILLYGASYIPVGEDQQGHIELTRDLATRLNNKFGTLFIVPHEWKKQIAFAGRKEGVRVRSLRNPDKKMSKSVDDPNGTIMLSDKPDVAAKKVMSAETDSLGKIQLDWEKQPGVSNLLQISALLSGGDVEDVAKDWSGKTSYGELKQRVADQVKVFLTDLQAKLASVDEKSLLSKLEEDEAKMNELANATLLKVQKAVGLRP